MKRQLFAAALGVAFSNAMAAAQDFRGDMTLSYSAFTEDTSINALSGTGSFEFGIGDRASVQFDVGLVGFGFTNSEATHAVLHAIFDVHPQGSAGLFMGIEDFEGVDVDYYGLEYGHSFAGGTFEVYAARGEEAGITGTVIGVEGIFALNDQWGMGVKLDNADFNGALDARRIGVRGIHALGQGTSVYAEVGSASVRVPGVTESEPFVGIGLNFELGSDKATFGQRSLMSLFPGL